MRPTLFGLQAAVLAANVLDADGTGESVAIASYHTITSGGMFHVEDLLRGQVLLEQAGLLRTSGGRLVPGRPLLALRDLPLDVAAELILRELILVERPLWLWAAIDGYDIRWENVPDTDRHLLERLIDDAERRESFLLGLARSIDTDALIETGSAGEEMVLAACVAYLHSRDRGDLTSAVRRVSLVSDELGYDITSPDTGGHRHRIEVKSTRFAMDRVEFFLSRNEALHGTRDPYWSVVFVCVDGQNDRVLGWCRSRTFSHLLPVDTTKHARWASVRITLELSQIRPGLPLDAS